MYNIHILQCWISWTTSTYLIRAGKERFASMHFDQYAAETPHVDGKVVRQTKKYLRWSIETTLYVLIDLSASAVSINDTAHQVTLTQQQADWNCMTQLITFCQEDQIQRLWYSLDQPLGTVCRLIYIMLLMWTPSRVYFSVTYTYKLMTIYCMLLLDVWWLSTNSILNINLKQLQTHTRLMALCPGLPEWAAQKRQHQSGFYWSKRQWVAVPSVVLAIVFTV